MKKNDIVIINNLIKQIELNNKIGTILKLEDNKFTVKLYNNTNIIKLNKKYLKIINPKTIVVGRFNNINDLITTYFSNDDKYITVNKSIKFLKLDKLNNNFLLQNIILDPIILNNNKSYFPFHYKLILENYDYFPNKIDFYSEMYDKLIVENIDYKYLVFFVIDNLVNLIEFNKYKKDWFINYILI